MRVAIFASVVRVSGCDDVSLTLSRQRDPYDMIRHRQGPFHLGRGLRLNMDRQRYLVWKSYTNLVR
jgi:hypothetical protein